MVTLMSDARQICQKVLPTRTQLCKPGWKQRNITYKVNALTFWILKVAHFEVLLNWSKGARNLHSSLQMMRWYVCWWPCMFCMFYMFCMFCSENRKLQPSFLTRWWPWKALQWLKLKCRWTCLTLICAHIKVGLAWKTLMLMKPLLLMLLCQ